MTSWLIDTNVPIYSYDESQKHHATSYNFLKKIIAEEITGSVAQQNILEFLAVVTGLLKKYGTGKRRIFNLYLAATALDNNISSISTWNVKDFQGIKEIDVKTPAEILDTLK